MTGMLGPALSVAAIGAQSRGLPVGSSPPVLQPEPSYAARDSMATHDMRVSAIHTS